MLTPKLLAASGKNCFAAFEVVGGEKDVECVKQTKVARLLQAAE